jgi:mRNA-degrading endonuclease RelE of RelBE toxin-antitoxin system
MTSSKTQTLPTTPDPTNTTFSHGDGSTGPKGIPLADLIEMHERGLTPTEIANLVGCSVGNVTTRIERSGVKRLKRFRKHTPAIIESILQEYTENISPEQIKKNLSNRGMTDIGILIDKVRLLNDKTTSNIAVLHANVQALRNPTSEQKTVVQNNNQDAEVNE